MPPKRIARMKLDLRAPGRQGGALQLPWATRWQIVTVSCQRNAIMDSQSLYENGSGAAAVDSAQARGGGK